MLNFRCPPPKILLISILLLLSACTLIPPLREPPPIMTIEELNGRPYLQLGRVQATREVYGIIDTQTDPDIREWGLGAIRQEAAKMGADAVILPEVSGNTVNYLVLPTTEYRATGIAIKFK